MNMVCSTKDKVIELEGIYNQLSVLESYAPNKIVNNIFGRLVKLVNCRCSNEHNILDNKKIQSFAKDMVRISSEAEGEMESYWAKKILNCKTKVKAKEVLDSFWYNENYNALIDFELNNLKKLKHFPKKIVFIGGGSLPLTSIILANNYKISSIVIECNENAVKLSSKVVKKLGLDDLIVVKSCYGEEFTDYTSIDTVYIASLAGIKIKEKQKIIKKIAQSIEKNTHVVIRSASQLRKLLYPKVETKSILSLQVIDEFEPKGEIINSSIICKKF